MKVEAVTSLKRQAAKILAELVTDTKNGWG